MQFDLLHRRWLTQGLHGFPVVLYQPEVLSQNGLVDVVIGRHTVGNGISFVTEKLESAFVHCETNQLIYLRIEEIHRGRNQNIIHEGSELKQVQQVKHRSQLYWRRLQAHLVGRRVNRKWVWYRMEVSLA